MAASTGFFIAGGLFMLAGVIQLIASGGGVSGASTALGVVFIALGAHKKKSEGAEK